MAIREITTGDVAPGVRPMPGRTRVGRVQRATLIVSAAAVGVAVLAGCGGSSSSGSASPASGAAAAAGSSADAVPTVPAARSGSAPTPEGDERKQLIYLEEAIDPGVSTDGDALVQKSVDVCGRMLKGEGGKTLDKDIQKEFANGSYLPQGEQITAFELALTQLFCR
jgi:hypothetical protein